MPKKQSKDQKEIERLTQELERIKDIAGRAQADLQNAKDRLERDAEELRKFAGASMLIDLLPVIDNLQRAFAHLPEDLKDHEWVKGIEAVEQNLMTKLSEAGLKKIESVGQPVDPEKHEVLQVGPGEKDQIIEVFEDGYELHEKVLRPAKVKVGDGS